MAKLVLNRLLLAALPLLAAAPAWAGEQPAMPPFPNRTDAASTMVWLKEHTTLGVGQHVVFGPDNVLVVVKDEVSTRQPFLHQVEFRQEAIRIDFVARTGGRSIKGAGEVDCSSGAYRSESSELYIGTDLQGSRIDHQGPAAIGAQPPGGSALSAMVQAVCGGGSALAPLASASRPAPAPDRPRPPAAEATDSRTISSTTLPPPPSAPAAAPPATASAVAAQIGAFGTREAAEKAWDRIAGLFPREMAGKSIRIDAAPNPGGAPLYRSSIVGFTDEAEARALCARLQASSEACLVRVP